MEKSLILIQVERNSQ